MSPSRAIDHRFQPRLIPILGMTSIAMSIGCVQPDSDRPWSTRGQSINNQPTAAAPPPSVTTQTTEASPSSEPVLLEIVAEDDQPSEPRAVAVAEEEVIPIPEPRQPTILQGDTPEARAISWLQEAIFNDYSLVRAYAYEAMEHDPSLLQEYGSNGLVDENRGVRFIIAWVPEWPKGLTRARVL